MSGAPAAHSKKVASCSESIVLFVEKREVLFLGCSRCDDTIDTLRCVLVLSNV